MGSARVILLDTHVALWVATNATLGAQTRALLERALADDRLAVSAISFWEIALLISKERFATLKAPEVLRTELLDTGIVELPLTGQIAILAVQLQNLHGDPADRFIAATAIAHGATLITADKRLLDWRHKLKRHNAVK
jgi:PIN domain nuclease of toxin-antitoxin system